MPHGSDLAGAHRTAHQRSIVAPVEALGAVDPGPRRGRDKVVGAARPAESDLGWFGGERRESQELATGLQTPSRLSDFARKIAGKLGSAAGAGNKA